MKIPAPKKVANGVYTIRMRLGGKNIVVKGSTATECRQTATVIKSEHIAGKVIQKRHDITVTEAIDKYINNHRQLSPSTIRGYRSIQKSVFKDAMPMRADMVDWQKEIDEETHAPKTVRNAWRFVASALSDSGIEPPRVNLPTPVPNEHPFLQPHQIPILIKAVEGQRCEIAVLLGLHSLRRSEILDISYNDVTDDIITVHGSAVLDEHGNLVHKKTNKNSASRRTVPVMIPRLVKAIADQKEKMGAKDTDYVVTAYPNSIYKELNRICKSVGLPQVGVHGLRHSFVSLAYYLGWSEMETMRICGYSDIKTMRKIYTHLADDTKSKDTQAMRAFLSGES